MTSTTTSLMVRLWRTPMRDVLRGELSGRLDTEATIRAAELPPLASNVVRATVRRTRLWRLEKAEVAEELLAHFAEGLSAGESADDLVASFGDPVSAAKLIRRAKKRQRPFAWKAVRRTGQILAAIVLLYAGYAVYFFSARAEPSVDYLALLNAEIAAGPAHERAWPAYQSALVMMDDLPDYDGWPTGENAAAVADFVDGNREPIESLREAAARPRLGFELRARSDFAHFGRPDHPLLHDSLLAVDLPQLGSLREAARALVLDAWRAAGNGDGDRVVADLEAILATAGHARETPFMITSLVSGAIAASAVHATGQILLEYPEALNDAQLEAVAQRLTHADALFGIDYTGERMYFRDLVQRVYTDDGDGDGRFIGDGRELLDALVVPLSDKDRENFPSRFMQLATHPGLSLMMLSRRDMLETHDRLMGEFEQEASKYLWQIDLEVDRQIAQWKASPVDSARYLPLVALMPALSRPMITAQQSMAHRDAVLVAIALERYRRAHGAWPDHIDALVPDFLAVLPFDRFDGASIRYALTEDGPVVYSVGTDRDDDQGQPPRDVEGNPWQSDASRWMAAEYIEQLKRQNAGAESAYPLVPDGDWRLWPPMPR